MSSFVNPNILKTSHPFSAIMGTLGGVIIAWKFLGYDNQVLHLALVYGLAQILTGMVNDYIDYESDLKYHPLKITSRGAISKKEIEPYIVVNLILLIILPFILFSIIIALMIFLGVVISQSYNIIFKDTPLSGIIFVISFGLMAIIPYIVKFGLDVGNIPIRFAGSGIILSLIAHLVNDLVDFEIDHQRNSGSMTQKLRRPNTLVLIVLGSLLVLPMQHNNLGILALLVILNLIIIFGITNKSYQIRELTYYGVSIISVVIIWLINLD